MFKFTNENIKTTSMASMTSVGCSQTEICKMIEYFFQKQSQVVFCQERCSQKFDKFHKKIHVLEYLFNNISVIASVFLPVILVIPIKMSVTQEHRK